MTSCTQRKIFGHQGYMTIPVLEPFEFFQTNFKGQQPSNRPIQRSAASKKLRDLYSCIHIKPKEENTKKKFLGRVLGPDGSSHHITHHTFISHHIKHHTFTCHHITHHKPKEENTKKKFLGRVLGPDGSSHHITHHTFTSHHIKHHTFTCYHLTHHKPKEENTKKKFLGRKMNIEEVEEPKERKSTSFFMKTPFKSIPEERKVRELPRKMKIEEVEEPKGRKSTSCIMKTPLRTIREQRKVRELPRKMKIEEVEDPKKHENYHAKPVSDPFKRIADTRKVRELPRKMNIEEVEAVETTRITTKIPRPTTQGETTKFTYKTNMQARKHVNSDELRPAPRSSTPAFSLTVRTPSVNHTVWGKNCKFVKGVVDIMGHTYFPSEGRKATPTWRE